MELFSLTLLMMNDPVAFYKLRYEKTNINTQAENFYPCIKNGNRNRVRVGRG